MSFLFPEKVTLLKKVDQDFSDIFDKQILYKNIPEIEKEKYNEVNHQISVDTGKEFFKKREWNDNGMVYASSKYFFAKVGNDHIIGSKIPFRDGWVGPTNCIVFKIYAKVSIEDSILIANKVNDEKYYKACEFKNYPDNQYYLTKNTQTGGKKQRKSMKSKKSRKIKNKKSRKSYSK